jgi:ATP-dependent Zn protease
MSLFLVFSFSFNDVHAHPESYVISAMKVAFACVNKTIIPKDVASFICLPRKTYHQKGSEVTAHHEAGHAVIVYNMKKLRIKSIVIDGYSGWVELEDFIASTKDEDIKDIIMMYLAGPAAEYEFNFTKKVRFISFDDCYQDLFKNYQWGSDIRSARKGAKILAQAYCEKNYKVFDQKIVKQEAERILKDCYRQTLMQVHAQRSDIQVVALILLQTKSISGKTFYAIMRKRKAR